MSIFMAHKEKNTQQEREETVAWNKETYNLLKQAEKGKVKSYVQDTALAVMDCLSLIHI